MDVVCGLTAFMVTKKKNEKNNKKSTKTTNKKSKENYNKTRKFSKRTSNRKPYALGQGKI